MADKSAGAPAAKSALTRSSPDIASFAGLAIALGAIIGGLMWEGGKITDVLQISAAVIVLGGTAGAVMVTSPMSALMAAVAELKSVFIETKLDPAAAVNEIIAHATKARKSSIVSLEEDLEKAGDAFLKKALSLAVDGTDLQELRKMMDLEVAQSEHHRESAAKVFEAAGGYAPTIGIIGAVLGLIQVMKHLENIEEVGKGIAVAFVATVYGVAAANLVFLPAANKLKARIRQDAQDKELLLEGVCSIVEGMNPKLIRVKLDAFVQHAAKPKKAEAEASGSPAAATAKG
ncbi:MAG TPA: flagellar motor protein [Bryobacteraceae bacterium]